MICQVLQPWLDAPIILAGDEDEAVRLANLAGELFQGRRRLARFVLLVHPVEHRQAQFLGIDQRDIIAARAKALDDELRQPDAHPVGAVGTVEDENAMRHDEDTAKSDSSRTKLSRSPYGAKRALALFTPLPCPSRLVKDQHPQFDALARRRIGRRRGISEGRVRPEPGPAVSRGVIALQ